MKLWQLAAAVLVMLIAADLVRGSLRSMTQPPPPDPDPEQGQMMPPPVTAPTGERLPLRQQDIADTWGPDTAPIKLQAYLPRGNPTGEQVVKAFQAIANAYPLKTQAIVIDMSKPGVAEAMVLKGIRMPFVAVDKKKDFEIVLDGKNTRIDFADVSRLKNLPLEKVLRKIVDQELELRRLQHR